MMDSFFTPVRDSNLVNPSATASTGKKNLSAISILAFTPNSRAGNPQNLTQFLSFLQKNNLQGQVSQHQAAKGEISSSPKTDVTLNLVTPLGQIQIKPLTPFTLPNGSQQAEIFFQQQRPFLRLLGDTPSPKIPADVLPQKAGRQSVLSSLSFQGKTPATAHSSSLQALQSLQGTGGVLKGLVVQSTSHIPPSVGASLGHSVSDTSFISAQSFGVLRSLFTSIGSTNPLAPSSNTTASIPQSSSSPVHLTLRNQVQTTANTPLFQGTVSQVSSSTNAGMSHAVIAFFGGVVTVSFPPGTPPVQLGEQVSFALAPAQTSQKVANATLNPIIQKISPTTTTTAQKPQALPSKGADIAPPSLTTGNALQLQVHAITLQGQKGQTVFISTPPANVTLQQGVFSHQTIAGANGIIKLDAPLNLPQGTQLHYTLQNPNSSPSSSPVVPLADTLLETMETLLTINAANMNTQNFQTLLPQTQSALMTPALLFLLSALGKGNPEQWLGKPLQKILNRHHPDLAKKLQRQFSPTRSSIASASNWQWFSFPIADQQSLEHIFFALYRRQPSAEDKEEHHRPAHEKRFRIASRFSNLGYLQIEGRIETAKDPLQPLKKQKFSLMIASEQGLSTTHEEEIRSIFRSLGDALHLEGYLHFRNTIDPTWVTTPPT